MLPDLTAEAPPAPALLLTQAQAWAYCGLSRPAWYRLRAADQLPRPIDIPGAGLRWRRTDLERWVERLRPSRKVRRGPSSHAGDQPHPDAG